MTVTTSTTTRRASTAIELAGVLSGREAGIPPSSEGDKE
jgi:hypothetical protein